VPPQVPSHVPHPMPPQQSLSALHVLPLLTHGLAH
jgi:hypothetical protein